MLKKYEDKNNNSDLTEYYNERTQIYEDYEFDFSIKFPSERKIYLNKDKKIYSKLIISIVLEKTYVVTAYEIYEDISKEQKQNLAILLRNETLKQVGSNVNKETKTTFLGLDAVEFNAKVSKMGTKGISFVKDDMIYIIMLSLNTGDVKEKNWRFSQVPISSLLFKF